MEKEKAAPLVMIGAMSDGRKEVLVVVPGYRESTEWWASVLRDLRDRSLETPRLLVADGNLYQAADQRGKAAQKGHFRHHIDREDAHGRRLG